MSTVIRAPWLGLVALGVGFLTQPLGHTIYKIMELSAGDAYPIVAFVVGVAGLGLIWRGLKKPELPATIHGLLGGWFLWIGWFEWSFKFFASLYQVPPYAVEVDGYSAAPQANMLQATLMIMLGLFIVYGIFNLQTKCNLMRWVHRNLRFSPGMPTPDNKRSFARITGMEILFVNIIMGLYVIWSAWAAYLIYKCTKQVRAAPALRYGVGAGIVLWGSAEMPAHFGAYREYWLYPNEFPIFNLLTTTLFVVGLVVLGRKRSGDRAMAPATE
jgi:hypothetical protein